MKSLRRIFSLILTAFILFGEIQSIQVLAATPDPKASNARVFVAGTNKSLSPQRGSRVDLFVTVQDKNLKAEDLKGLEKPVTIRKKEDSFEAKNSEYGQVVDGIKNSGDGIIFRIMFSDLEYTGSGSKLRFDLTYGLDNAEKISLSVNVPNCVEYNYNDYTGKVPKIEVSNITFPATIKDDQTFLLEFDAAGSLKDVVFKNVELDYSEVSSGIETTSIVDTKKLPNFKTEGSNSMQIELKTKEKLENDFETITLKYTYSYRQNGEMKDDQTNSVKIKIPVIKNTEEEEDDMSATPYVVLEDYKYGSQVLAGKEFTVQGTFKNTSNQYDIENVTIVFTPSDGLVSKEASNKIFIHKLPKGGTKTEKLSFLADKDTATGFQTINYEIHYEYKKNKKKETKDTTESMKISVKGKKKKDTEEEKIGKRTPAVMISEYTYGGKVPAGKKFMLDMTLKNTSKDLKIENLIVSLEVAEGLSITSSSNTFYFDSLSANGIANQKVEMQALPNAKSASTNITVNFKYEYIDKKQRNSVTSSETIAIPIYQPDRMKITMLEMPEMINVGEETNLSIQYVNKGKSSVYNLAAELKGDLTSSEKIQNLGNVDSGNSGSIDFYVTAQQAGEVKGEIIITYEDDNLETKEIKLPYSLQAQEVQIDPGMIPGEPGIDPSMNPEGENPEGKVPMTKQTKIILGATGGAVAALVLGVTIMKKKKAKKLKMLEELEEMEDNN